MAKILITATHGSEDPTRAGLPFVVAKGAVEGGHQVSVALLGEGALLMKQPIPRASFRWGCRRSRSFFSLLWSTTSLCTSEDSAGRPGGSPRTT